MWYCLKCDTSLDEFQIVYDINNRPKCGVCRGDVEQVDVCTHGIGMDPMMREGARSQEDNKGVVATQSPPIIADVDGLSMVDHYVGLLKAKQELEAEIEEAKSKIIEFVEKMWGQHNKWLNKTTTR